MVGYDRWCVRVSFIGRKMEGAAIIFLPLEVIFL
jgi:hypothetical protein